MNKKSVLIVGGFPNFNSNYFGGVVTSCRVLLQSSFAKRFSVITLDSTQKSNPMPPTIIRMYFAIIRIINFLIILLFQRPRAVILFTSIKTSIIEKGFMAWLAFFLRIPVLMFPRGGPILNQVKNSKITSIWVRYAFMGSTKILCQGPAWVTFSKQTLKFSKSDTPIIYNWTATERLLNIGKNKILTKSSSIIKILYLGWVEEMKGIYDLLDACSQIRTEHEFQLCIVGGGSCLESAKNETKNKNMDKFVKFYGWLNDREVEEIFKNSDVLVQPSWVEGFPNSIIEAMAAGLAVITTSVGNIPDILNNDKEALLIPKKNIKALKNSISRIIEDQELRAKISKTGHEFALNNFSTEKAAIKLEEVINQVTK